MDMGSTLVEKILAHASGKQVVCPGEIVQADIDLAMMHDTTGPQAVAALTEIGAPGVWDRDKVMVILDHLVPAPHSNAAQLQKAMRDFAQREQIINYYDINAGVCHQVLVEKGHVQPANHSRYRFPHVYSRSHGSFGGGYRFHRNGGRTGDRQTVVSGTNNH